MRLFRVITWYHFICPSLVLKSKKNIEFFFSCSISLSKTSKSFSVTSFKMTSKDLRTLVTLISLKKFLISSSVECDRNMLVSISKSRLFSNWSQGTKRYRVLNFRKFPINFPRILDLLWSKKLTGYCLSSLLSKNDQ